jgi:hypothetical protein
MIGTMDPRDVETLERCTRHEAAHAVVARVLGFTVTRVYLYIRGDRRVGGNTETSGGGFGDDLWARMGTVAAAGAASDRAEGYDLHASGSDGDVGGGGMEQARRNLRQDFDFVAKADELVAEHQREIDMVATALWRAGELSGDQVDELIEIDARLSDVVRSRLLAELVKGGVSLRELRTRAPRAQPSARIVHHQNAVRPRGGPPGAGE